MRLTRSGYDGKYALHVQYGDGSVQLCGANDQDCSKYFFADNPNAQICNGSLNAVELHGATKVDNVKANDDVKSGIDSKANADSKTSADSKAKADTNPDTDSTSKIDAKTSDIIKTNMTVKTFQDKGSTF